MTHTECCLHFGCIDMDKTLRIWTDGSCRQSTSFGGIGIVFTYDSQIIHEIAKRFDDTTNNRMEITAIIWALQEINTPVKRIEIYSDSQYCLGCITKGWKRNANTDLWEQFDQVYKHVRDRYCQNIEFIYTAGHDSDFLNNRADLLATVASGFRKAPKNFEMNVWTGSMPPKCTAQTEITTHHETSNIKPMIIGLDFDGTVVTHMYPEIGENIGAVPVLKALAAQGHQFVLNTMRDDKGTHRNCLKEAEDWFKNNGIELLGVNKNPTQHTWTTSPKVYAHLYIDDAALGTPTILDPVTKRPCVDWARVVAMLVKREILPIQSLDLIEEICNERERLLSPWG